MPNRHEKNMFPVRYDIIVSVNAFTANVRHALFKRSMRALRSNFILTTIPQTFTKKYIRKEKRLY